MMVVLRPLLFSLCILPTIAASAEPKDELVDRLEAYREMWSEGYIEAKTQGVWGPADVKAWWAGDRVRREFNYAGIMGADEPRLTGHVMSSSEYCRFTPELLQAKCTKLIEFQGLNEPLRVLPHESWLEIGPKKPLEEWLESSPGATRVVRSAKEFVAIFTPTEADAEICVQAIADSGIDGVNSAALSEFGLIGHFNKSGLPRRVWYVGKTLENQLKLEWEWSDEPVPALITFKRKHTTDSGATFKLDFGLDVLKASRKLPEKSPSLSIPPKDLPFGTRVVDARRKGQQDTYVGGEEGKAHFFLQQTARNLEKSIQD